MSPVPFDRPSFDQIMYALKCSGEAGDILCTHAAEEIERLQKLASAAPELLAALKEGLHQLENSTGKHDLIQLFRAAINKAEGRGDGHPEVSKS